MCLTRNQIENLSRVKLIKDLLNFSDSRNKLKTLHGRFNTFTAKNKELKSELDIRKNCTSMVRVKCS